MLARVIRLSRRPNPNEMNGNEVPFDDGFDDVWTNDELELDGYIALIPSVEFRRLLETAAEGINFGWALGNKTGYEVGYRAAVHKVGRLGFDLISSWMRDEQAVDASLRERVAELALAIEEYEEQYQIELEESRKPKGY
jgi:hypothetical protein